MSEQKVNRFTRVVLLVLLISSMNIGCATSGKSILAGAAAGGAVGAAIGNNKGDSKDTAVGAATGMLLGGLIGYLSHKNKKSKGKLVLKENRKGSGNLPFITKPIIRKYSPDPKIEGNKYIRNCEIFEIKENAKWRKK